ERTRALISCATASLGLGAGVMVDLAAGTLGAVTNYGGHVGGSAAIQNCGGGIYRVSLFINGTAANYYPSVGLANGAGATNYAGDGTSGLFVWQAQTLLGNFPDGGPIIVTAGATASIGASVLALTLANATLVLVNGRRMAGSHSACRGSMPPSSRWVR
ncbi:MAG: hypothetical protein V4653_11215, partial [Pseudomonadota bacterium]